MIKAKNGRLKIRGRKFALMAELAIIARSLATGGCMTDDEIGKTIEIALKHCPEEKFAELLAELLVEHMESCLKGEEVNE